MRPGNQRLRKRHLGAVIAVVAVLGAGCDEDANPQAGTVETGGDTSVGPDAQEPMPGLDEDPDDLVPEPPASPTGERPAPEGEGQEAVPEVVANEHTVVAQGISFRTDEVVVPAREEVRITFENEDDGIRHSLHVIVPGDDPRTQIAPGPVTQTLAFPAPAAGNYRIICDVHDSMSATLTVIAPEVNPIEGGD